MTTIPNFRNVCLLAMTMMVWNDVSAQFETTANSRIELSLDVMDQNYLETTSVTIGFRF
ncbi:MAG TPA: hypothetical protein VI603_16315 [Saprospiraceae bacterium]|nr:hypothetical protein [Saprospiraceae bacterium]